MLDHLEIHNFMVFEHLKIPQLKRVNLIAGKNNVGKTTLLDAIRILEAEGEESVLSNILGNRNLFENWYETYINLFNKKIITLTPLIINDWAIHYSKTEGAYVVTECERYDTLPKDSNLIFDFINDQVGYLHLGNRNRMLKGNSSGNPRDNVVFIPFQDGEFEKLSEFWEQISLTPKEDDVLEIVRESIEPGMLRFDVGKNKVRIRLKDAENPVPLKTLGDGVQRILLIALALANAQGKVLLIDEIEMGLHYSVLEKLWTMIFKYAQKWDIQVFVTTHSQDAIKSFYHIADNEKYENDAQFIRLQHSRKGPIEAITYGVEDLEDLLDLEIEVR